MSAATIDAGGGWSLTLPADAAALYRRWDTLERVCAQAQSTARAPSKERERVRAAAERELAQVRAAYSASVRRAGR
jgi:hypothetical protein